ncbi:DUF3710 domain-containing protein [Sphaerisporangium fuscum]|uniref:DUF3710 domain-containing protein n=1 Tax=Sphaerisporangium fuscum TaxID=2835868 RepID=UPI001BDD226F|nr:DUF3710 domain-containing protein [Sphaerisporangium fuscum]
MFRRRRHAEAEETAPATGTAPVPQRESGPWDAEEPHPDTERVDLGGLRLPIGPGFEVQLNVAGDQIVGAVVLVDESALQLHAFAAPKKSGIWDEVRAELARELSAAGGSCEEREGPFGTELAAEIQQEGTAQPVRFIGVDGPRWFLRCVISGRAIADPGAAEILEGVVRDVVVVRGDQPMAPKDPIELRLPAEARHAVDQHAEGEQKPDLNPFERGPEISEIR